MVQICPPHNPWPIHVSSDFNTIQPQISFNFNVISNSTCLQWGAAHLVASGVCGESLWSGIHHPCFLLRKNASSLASGDAFWPPLLSRLVDPDPWKPWRRNVRELVWQQGKNKKVNMSWCCTPPWNTGIDSAVHKDGGSSLSGWLQHPLYNSNNYYDGLTHCAVPFFNELLPPLVIIFN